MRYPEYLLKEIPDVHVSLGTYSQPFLVKASNELEYKAMIFPTGNPEKDTILVNLTRFCPGPTPRSDADVMKCVKYIDQIPKNSVIITHEYEHALQNLKDRLPKSIGMRQSIPKYAISKLSRIPIFLPLAIGLARLSKDFRKMMIEHDLGEYILNPVELEARLAQFIFLKVKGYSDQDIIAVDQPVEDFLSTPEKVREKMKEFKRRISELQENKKLMPRSDKRRTKKEIRRLEWYLILSEHYVKDFEYLLTEADRVAHELIEKRKATLG